jgi:polyhydroxybutyrate depolymerase
MRVFTATRFLCLTTAVTVALAGPATAPAQTRAKDRARPAALHDLENLDLTIDSVSRAALVRVPDEAKVNPAPVVFAFHGHGGTMNQAADEFAIHKHWPQAIVVYMQGLPTKASNDPEGKESGWQYNVGENGDRDVQFFDAVLADLRKSCKIDNKRVYAVGFSNGGGFAFVLWSARGDQVAAVVSCAMRASNKLISTFKAKPLLQIAGKQDKLQSVANQLQTVMAVAKLNECDEGRPWGGRKNCTLYPSKIGAPVVFLVHNGKHEVPKEAPSRIVEFLNSVTPSSQTGNPAVGLWKLNQPFGVSNLQITEKAGKLEDQEIGQGNAKGTTVSCKDGLLVIHWEVGEDLRGYWVLNLNEEHTKGSGRTVFVRWPEGFEPGEPQEIEGRKVRVAKGVTIERESPKAP